MATVVSYGDGLRRVEFGLGSDTKRQTVRLGRVNAKDAAAFALRVETLIRDRMLGRAHSPETCEWLAGLPMKSLDRLRAAGLTNYSGNADLDLDGLLRRFEESITGGKPATRLFYGHTLRNLREHFGADRRVSSITAEDADRFAAWLRADAGLAKATANRRIKAAGSIFRKAVRWEYIGKSPFDNVKAGGTVNKERTVYIPAETVERLIDATPDAEWKALLAIGRWMGVRVQSEGLGLRVADLDWERSAVWVRSPKTEHHGEEHAGRWVPMFPEVREHLLRLYEQAAEGQVYLFDRQRFASGNLRTGLLKLIKRCGLKPWPRLWHNFRTSRATELVAEYPMATAAAWLGHSVGIMAAHYITSPDLDSDFQKAVKKGAVKSAVRGGELDGAQESGAESTSEKTSGNQALTRSDSPTLSCAHVYQVGSEGLEPTTFSV